jgi:hypothetical protein
MSATSGQARSSSSPSSTGTDRTYPQATARPIAKVENKRLSSAGSGVGEPCRSRAWSHADHPVRRGTRLSPPDHRTRADRRVGARLSDDLCAVGRSQQSGYRPNGRPATPYIYTSPHLRLTSSTAAGRSGPRPSWVRRCQSGAKTGRPIFPRRALHRVASMPAVANINCAGEFPTALCASLPSRVQGRGPPPVTVDLPRAHPTGVSRVRRRPCADGVADDAHRWPYAMFADVVSKAIWP